MGKLSEQDLRELQDPETWEDGAETVLPAAKSPRAVVSVAFSREDYQQIVAHARQLGMKTSEFIRKAALAQTTAKAQRVTVESVSGAVRTAHPPVTGPNSRVVVTMPEPDAFTTS